MGRRSRRRLACTPEGSSESAFRHRRIRKTWASPLDWNRTTSGRVTSCLPNGVPPLEGSNSKRIISRRWITLFAAHPQIWGVALLFGAAQISSTSKSWSTTYMSSRNWRTLRLSGFCPPKKYPTLYPGLRWYRRPTGSPAAAYQGDWAERNKAREPGSRQARDLL